MNKVNTAGQLYLKLRLISFFILLFFNFSLARSGELITGHDLSILEPPLETSQPGISSATLSGTSLTINFSAPTSGGTPTGYEFSLDSNPSGAWSTLSYTGSGASLVGTVTDLSPNLTEFYIRAVYGPTQTLLNTFPKPMTSGWSQNLPATDPAKTYKMVVSGTWGIARNNAHRDAAYDAGSNNIIGQTGTPNANRYCDVNWLFEGV